jgi:hypothetical protein
MLWVTVGGPAASWALAIAAVALAIFGAARSQVWLSTLLTALVFWSVLGGIASLSPNRGKYAVNDGDRLRMLVRGGPQADQFVSITILLAHSVQGQRPREWDPDLVRRAAYALDDNPDLTIGQALRYNWLHDTRQLEEAGPLVEWIAGRIHTGEGQAVWQLEAAWFQARYCANLLAARQWFDRVAGPGKSPASRCAYFKAKAAIDLAEQRCAHAEASAHQVLREAEKLTHAGIATAIRDEAERVLEEVKFERDQG